MKCLCVASAPGETATVVDHVRLFRNDARHIWKYRVHEQILPALRTTKAELCWSDVVILHTGYVDPVHRRHKLERDLKLLQRKRAEQADEPFTLFNIGSVFRELNQPGEALAALSRSLQLSRPSDSIVRKLYALIAQSQRDLGQAGEALRTCSNGRKIYPEDAELLFLESVLLRQSGDNQSAEERLHRLIDGSESAHFASVDVGLRGFKARHNLAIICMEQNRIAEAENHWLAALNDEPAFIPAQAGLGRLYAQTKNTPKLEKHAQLIEKFGTKGAEQAWLLRGLGKMHLGELTEARQLLMDSATRFPQSLGIKRLLAQITFKVCPDPTAGLQVLHDILKLDPNDEQAKKLITKIGNDKRGS